MPAPAAADFTTATGRASATISRPANAATGDVLVMAVQSWEASSIAAADFTEVGAVTSLSARARLFRRRITEINTEPSSYSITGGSSFAGAIAALLVRVTGVDPDNIVSASAVTASATFNAPDPTTTIADSLVIAFFGHDLAGVSSPPAGYTAIADVNLGQANGDEFGAHAHLAARQVSGVGSQTIGTWGDPAGGEQYRQHIVFALGGLATPSPPTISGPATGTVREGLPVNSTQVADITADNTPTSYAASGGPAGMTLNTSTGVFGGTPDPGTAGEYEVTLTATNAGGTSSNFTLTLTVEDNTAPAIATPPGSAFEYQFEATYTPIAGESAPTWSATGVPDGLSLSSGGLLSGDLPAAAAYDMEVTCTAATGATDTKTYRLVVQTSPPAGGAIRMSLLGVG